MKGYTRKDGTYVAPHTRSAPDGNFGNNWSTKGNINPYTGEEGTRASPPAPVGASGIQPPSPQSPAVPTFGAGPSASTPPPMSPSGATSAGVASDPLAGVPDFQRRAVAEECKMYPQYGGGWTTCVQRHRAELTKTDPLGGVPDFQQRAVTEECKMYPRYGGGWTTCVQRHRAELTKTDPLDGLPDLQRNAVVAECKMYPRFGGGWTSCVVRHRGQLTNGNQPRVTHSLSVAPANIPERPAAPLFRRQTVRQSRTGGCLPYLPTGSGHWLNENDSDGAILTLEDGSVWRVDDVDRIDTMLWLPVSDITVVESDDSPSSYLLVNTDDDEKVGACFLGHK